MLRKKGIGIICLTRQGLELAKMISATLPDSVTYTSGKLADGNVKQIEGKLKDFTRILFDQHSSLLFIMATGIVVRCIAPWLKNKQLDPAVVVMDDKAKHAISLLSGHLGGANSLCEQIASITGADAVITTASDVNGLPSVDMIAQKNGFAIDSMEDAKVVTALIVDHKAISIIDSYERKLKNNYFPEYESSDALILVSNRLNTKVAIPSAKMIPRNIHLGLGCKRGVDCEVVKSFVITELQKLHIDTKSIASVSSIWLKADEEALLSLAQFFNMELRIFSKEEVSAVEHSFEGSKFVKKTIGVSCVSEPVAYLSGNRRGEFLLQKKIHEGITLSIFESDIKVI